MELTKDDILHEIEEVKQEKDAIQEVIPKGYEIEQHQNGVALYQIIPSKKMANQIRKYLSLIQFPKLLNDSKILKAMK